MFQCRIRLSGVITTVQGPEQAKNRIVASKPSCVIANASHPFNPAPRPEGFVILTTLTLHEIKSSTQNKLLHLMPISLFPPVCCRLSYALNRLRIDKSNQIKDFPGSSRLPVLHTASFKSSVSLGTIYSRSAGVSQEFEPDEPIFETQAFQFSTSS